MKDDFFLGLAADGFHRIHVAIHGTDGSVPPVLCVHGLARNGSDFDCLGKALTAERGGLVYAPDMPGRGQSDWLHDPALYGTPTYMNDLTALIARTGARQVDWVGTSMGGLLGMFMAAQPNTPIRRLVLNDIGPFVSLAALEKIAGYLKDPPSFASPTDLETHLRRIYAGFGQLTDAQWAHMASMTTKRLENGACTLNYDPAIVQSVQAAKADVDLWGVYDKLSCPTLVLRGANSEVLLPDVAREMTRRGPKAALVEIEGAAHAPALMDARQIALVSNFLSAHAPT